MRELFVYYRIRPGMSAAAHDAVATMQRALRSAHPDLVARLLKRRDTTSGDETWMETYAARPAAAAEGVADAIEAEILSRSVVLAPFIDGQRHTERFEADPPV